MIQWDEKATVLVKSKSSNGNQDQELYFRHLILVQSKRTSVCVDLRLPAKLFVLSWPGALPEVSRLEFHPCFSGIN